MADHSILNDPSGISAATYGFVVLISSAGGAIRYFNNESKLKAFSFLRLCIDVTTSAFAGVMTYWVTVYMKIDPTFGSMLVAIGGFLGVNAIREFERIYLNLIRKGEDK